MNKSFIKFIFLLLFFQFGCSTGLNKIQKEEYYKFEKQGILIKEKSPVFAVLLGILPGGGSFYARKTGLGIINLWYWPISILWDPVSGYDGAMEVNYYLTKDEFKKNELFLLKQKLKLNKISKEEYFNQTNKIEQKYYHNPME